MMQTIIQGTTCLILIEIAYLLGMLIHSTLFS